MTNTAKFTTKGAMIDGRHYKAIYSLEGAILTVKLVCDDGGKTELILTESHEWYKAAMIAYETKQAKRAAGQIDMTTVSGLVIKGAGYTIKMDSEIDRATVTFSRKPAPEIRELVKAYGFWWTPSHKCWSRRLNSSAWIASQELHRKLSA